IVIAPPAAPPCPLSPTRRSSDLVPGAPTGTVFNSAPRFVVTSGTQSGPARFIFASEDGTISGWTPEMVPSSLAKMKRAGPDFVRLEQHTSELQSRDQPLVRLQHD